MKLTVSHSNDPLTSAAIEELLDDCRRQLGDEQPVAGLFFAQVDADHHAALNAILDAFPDLALIGCTTDGEVSSALQFQEDSLALALLCGPGLRARAGLGRSLSEDPGAAARQAAAAATLEGEAPRLCLTLPESLTVSAVSTVAALTEALPEGTALVGGTAGDQWRFEGTKQFCGRQVATDGVPVLALYGELEFAVGLASGWCPIGEPGAVGRADGNVVYEIGEGSALAFYRRYFGDHVEPNPEFPLEVVDRARTEHYLRAPMAYNEADGSVTYAGDVPTGSTVQITVAARDEILEGCKASVSQALEGLGSARPAGAIVISCAARKQVLGTRTANEHEVLRGLLGDVPILGFYSYGEIAPIHGQTVSSFHNETFVTLLLGA